MEMLLVLKGPCFEKKPQMFLRCNRCNVIGNAYKSSLRVRGQHTPELTNQRFGLVQSLQHQTEFTYEYFKEYESMFRIVRITQT